MNKVQTCEACGQPLLMPIGMQNCQTCNKRIGETGGRYVNANGICAPYCFLCAPVEPKEGALL